MIKAFKTYRNVALLLLVSYLLVSNGCKNSPEQKENASQGGSVKSPDDPAPPLPPDGEVKAVPAAFLGEWFNQEECRRCDSKSCSYIFTQSQLTLPGNKIFSISIGEPGKMENGRLILARKEGSLETHITLERIQRKLSFTVKHPHGNLTTALLEGERKQCDEALTDREAKKDAKAACSRENSLCDILQCQQFRATPREHSACQERCSRAYEKCVAN